MAVASPRTVNKECKVNVLSEAIRVSLYSMHYFFSGFGGENSLASG